MTKNKIILTDVDGVILDFASGFYDFISETHGIEIPEEAKSNYYIYKDLGLENYNQQEIMTDYAHSEHFTRLPAKECAKQVLQQLRKDGWRFVAITACDTGLERQCHKKTYQNRMDNLEAHFGNIFEDLHLSNWERGKTEFLKRYEPTWWIDDRVSHAEDGHKLGHKSIVMHTEDYKRQENKLGLPVAQSWFCIKNFIEKDEEFSYNINHEKKIVGK